MTTITDNPEKSPNADISDHEAAHNNFMIAATIFGANWLLSGILARTMDRTAPETPGAITHHKDG